MRALVTLAAVLLSAPLLEAQEVRGSVLDERGGPVGDAQIIVRDSTQTVAAILRTTALGVFQARLRREGRYEIEVRRVGYQPTARRTIVVTADSAAQITVHLTSAPVQLSPVTVRAQRDSIRRRTIMGMSLRSIAGNIVTPAEFELRTIGARNVVDALRNTAPWISVRSVDELECLSSTRVGGLARGGPPCLLVLVDGRRIEPPWSLNSAVPLNAVDFVVFLRPAEAGALFGNESENGVVLIYTKTGPASGLTQPR